jgi:hypothetical protein
MVYIGNSWCSSYLDFISRDLVQTQFLLLVGLWPGFLCQGSADARIERVVWDCSLKYDECLVSVTIAWLQDVWCQPHVNSIWDRDVASENQISVPGVETHNDPELSLTPCRWAHVEKLIDSRLAKIGPLCISNID